MDRTTWPLSNYPILAAILLLIATAAALALGYSEEYANQLAIYAYYGLVIGVALRVLEMAVPSDAGTRVKTLFDRVGWGETIDRLKTVPALKEVSMYLGILAILALAYLVFL